MTHLVQRSSYFFPARSADLKVFNCWHFVFEVKIAVFPVNGYHKA